MNERYLETFDMDMLAERYTVPHREHVLKTTKVESAKLIGLARFNQASPSFFQFSRTFQVALRHLLHSRFIRDLSVQIERECWAMGKLFMTSLLTAATLVGLWVPARADVLYGGVQYKNTKGCIGVSVNKKGLIRLVHPDSPAAEAGLAAGDVVESVNGKLNDVWNIHGMPETYVTLMVRRGELKFQVKVKRIDYRDIHHDTPIQTIGKTETA